jgi:hypothetical protein
MGHVEVRTDLAIDHRTLAFTMAVAPRAPQISLAASPPLHSDGVIA